LFSNIIDYLQDGTLPADRDAARKLLFQIEWYFIEHDQLWRLVPVRNKNLQQLQPRVIRLCIPVCYRLTVLESFHDVGHPGFLRTLETIRTRYFWPNLTTDVKQFVMSCETCVKIKKANKVNYGLNAQRIGEYNDLVSYDHHSITVPNAKHPYKYVLTMTEHLTQNTVFVATRTTSASETARAMYDNYLTVYGYPKNFLSDRHKAFMGELMTSLMKLVPGGKVLHSSPRRAMCNSVSELCNKKIISFLRVVGQHEEWPKFLSTIGMVNRYLVSSSTKASPYRLLYGVEMRIPLDTALLDNPPDCLSQNHAVVHFAEELKLLRDLVRANVNEQREATCARFNKDARPHTFKEGQTVFLLDTHSKPGINQKHSPVYSGPYFIVAVRGPLVKLQNIYTGRTLKSFINVDQIRPYSAEDRDRLYNRLGPSVSNKFNDELPPTDDVITSSVLPAANSPTTNVNSLSPTTVALLTNDRMASPTPSHGQVMDVVDETSLWWDWSIDGLGQTEVEQLGSSVPMGRVDSIVVPYRYVSSDQVGEVKYSDVSAINNQAITTLTDTDELPLDLSIRPKTIGSDTFTPNLCDETTCKQVTRNNDSDILHIAPSAKISRQSADIVGASTADTVSPCEPLVPPTTSSFSHDQIQHRFVRLSAKRLAYPYALYKAHIANDNDGTWIPASQLPAQLIIDFNLRRVHRLNRKRGIS
jgi:hypothetical protein